MQEKIKWLVKVSLRPAAIEDKSLVVAFDYALDKDHHLELKEKKR